jgi:superfamily II DNA or RNA helicase
VRNAIARVEWEIVVMDEVHERMKNASTNMYARLIDHTIIPRYVPRIGLTGTPMQNSLKELFTGETGCK